MQGLDQVLTLWEKLAERERLITQVFMRRLYAGQQKYGPITPGKKNWTFEALEEALDGSVYLCAALQDAAEQAQVAAEQMDQVGGLIEVMKTHIGQVNLPAEVGAANAKAANAAFLEYQKIAGTDLAPLPVVTRRLPSEVKKYVPKVPFVGPDGQ